MIAIKHRYTKTTLFEFDVETVRDAAEAAVKFCANLSGAYLRHANLICADLSDANLIRTYLSEANLSGANMSGEKLTKPPLFVSNLLWPVTITEKFLTIGCQQHEIEHWSSFSDDNISKMHFRALDFWKTWKAPLLLLWATYKDEA